VAVDQRVSTDKDEIPDKSYPFIRKIDDGITVRVCWTEIKKIDARTSQHATKIKTESFGEGDVWKIGAFPGRLKVLVYMDTSLLMGNNICPSGETHQAVDMIAVWDQTGLVDTKVEDSPIEEVDRFNPDIEGRSQYIVRRDGLTGFFHPGAHQEENILPEPSTVIELRRRKVGSSNDNFLVS